MPFFGLTQLVHETGARLDHNKRQIILIHAELVVYGVAPLGLV